MSGVSLKEPVHRGNNLSTRFYLVCYRSFHFDYYRLSVVYFHRHRHRYGVAYFFPAEHPVAFADAYRAVFVAAVVETVSPLAAGVVAYLPAADVAGNYFVDHYYHLPDYHFAFCRG